MPFWARSQWSTLSSMILIVDDVPDTCSALVKYLRKAGYAAEAVHSARECLAFVANTRPELILLDVNMPEMDGIMLLRAIRNDPNLKDLPVMMCSADCAFERVKESLALGAKEYLVKGVFDLSAFQWCIGQYATKAITPSASHTTGA